MMSDRNSTPQPSDAVLGGQNPAPLQGAILGGVEGIKQQLTNPDVELRLKALELALNYGNAGRVCLEQALSDRSKLVRRRARWLLRPKYRTKNELTDKTQIDIAPN
jgi:hypothetical protein